MTSPYEISKQSKGKHHGWYLQQRNLPIEDLQNGIASFERQIAKHTGWIADPSSKAAGFDSFDHRRQQALVDRLATRQSTPPRLH